MVNASFIISIIIVIAIIIVVTIIVISKPLKRHSKFKRRVPASSRALIILMIIKFYRYNQYYFCRTIYSIMSLTDKVKSGEGLC